MEKSKFKTYIFDKVNNFKCPCCGLSYYKESFPPDYENKYAFEETFGSGYAIQKDDKKFECAYCSAELELDTSYPNNAKLIKKQHVKPNLSVATEKDISKVTEQFSSISDIKLNSKTGELTCVDVNGKKYSLNIFDAVLCHALVGEKVKADIKSYLDAKAKNAQIDEENEKLQQKQNG